MKSPLFRTTTTSRSPSIRTYVGAPRHPTYGGAKPKLEGCANTNGGKTKRCSPVPFELNDREGCTRSMDNNRCIARPEPRKCEWNQSSKSSRCRISKTGHHDNRCTVSKKTGRCGLAKQPTSPKASPSHRAHKVVSDEYVTGGYVFY